MVQRGAHDGQRMGQCIGTLRQRYLREMLAGRAIQVHVPAGEHRVVMTGTDQSGRGVKRCVRRWLGIVAMIAP